jgi:gamma-glutamyltranspeptidase
MYEGGFTSRTLIRSPTPSNGEIQVWQILNIIDKTNVPLIYTTVQVVAHVFKVSANTTRNHNFSKG